MNKAYERETEMWNQVFKECTPVDLRTLDLQVETMFDEALKLFAQKTTNVLDFGCGTGDISFQYLQYQPTHLWALHPTHLIISLHQMNFLLIALPYGLYLQEKLPFYNHLILLFQLQIQCPKMCQRR